MATLKDLKHLKCVCGEGWNESVGLKEGPMRRVLKTACECRRLLNVARRGQKKW